MNAKFLAKLWLIFFSILILIPSYSFSSPEPDCSQAFTEKEGSAFQIATDPARYARVFDEFDRLDEAFRTAGRFLLKIGVIGSPGQSGPTSTEAKFVFHPRDHRSEMSTLYFAPNVAEGFDLEKFKIDLSRELFAFEVRLIRVRDLTVPSSKPDVWLEVVVILSFAGEAHSALGSLVPPGSFVLGGTRCKYVDSDARTNTPSRWTWVNSVSYKHLPGLELQANLFPIEVAFTPDSHE